MIYNCMIDTHCHLQYLTQEQLQIFLENSYKLHTIINIGTKLNDNWPIKFFNNYSDYKFNVYSGFGIHPCEVRNTTYEQTKEYLLNMVTRSDCICIGESGIDLLKDNNLTEQIESLNLHCQICKDFNKTLIIHSRNVNIDIILHEVLKYNIRFVFHSFSYSADEIIKLNHLKNAYVSFSGMCTFNNTNHIREAIAIANINNILTETDSPFLAPVPIRGKLNLPSNVEHIYKQIAEIKQISKEDLILQIRANFKNAFNI